MNATNEPSNSIERLYHDRAVLLALGRVGRQCAAVDRACVGLAVASVRGVLDAQALIARLRTGDGGRARPFPVRALQERVL